MAVALDNFSDWLDNKLRDLNTDENVFGSYIIGILDSDETPDEKNEALQGILAEIVENVDNIEAVCSEVLEQWSKFKQKEPPPAGGLPPEDVDVKLARLLESQCLQTTAHRQYTPEERKIREAILSQYSQTSDDEGEAGEEHGPSSAEGALRKNTNAQNVAQAEKEKRENARAESQRKKDKDKEDREKQKQMKEEKKEKRKTQKGERRR